MPPCSPTYPGGEYFVFWKHSPPPSFTFPFLTYCGKTAAKMILFQTVPLLTHFTTSFSSAPHRESRDAWTFQFRDSSCLPSREKNAQEARNAQVQRRSTEIMDETWRWQDESGIIRGYPELVVKYISDPFLTIEEKAVLLRDRVKTNLIRRLNTQPRSVLLTPITNIFTDTKPRPANSHEAIYFWPVEKSHSFYRVPHKACFSQNTTTASSHYPWRVIFRSECLQTGYWTYYCCGKRRTGIPRPQHNRKRTRLFSTLGSIPCREGRPLYTFRYDCRPYWGLWELGKDGASWWKWTT